MTPSMPKSPHSPQSWEELRLERLRELKRLRQRKRAAQTAAVVSAEAEKYGELVDQNEYSRSYERTDDDGKLISSLVYEAPTGGHLVYEIVGARWSDLL